MRAFVTFLLLGVALKAFPQVGRAEYYFDDASLDYSQGISLTVPVNTGDVEITGEISASALSPGFHQVFFYGDFKEQMKDFCQLCGFKAQVV